MVRLVSWISILCALVASVVGSAERYAITHHKKGTCIIINNINFEARTGLMRRDTSPKDVSSLRTAFTSLGFEVRLHTDVKKADLLNIARTASTGQHNADAFAMVILTHGGVDHLYAVDERFKLEDILAFYKGDKSPSLVGKPKLFFIEAPRGSNYDNGVLYTPPRTKRTVGPKIPIEADFLLAYSTCPGYTSWTTNRRGRFRVTKGSWFVAALVRVIKENRLVDVLRMMTRVNHIMAFEYDSKSTSVFRNHRKQMPEILSMLTKDLYF